jgi:hypothetical protein
LREEFIMADEVFALSPISARAAMPSEDDYAAISEAFMETSRGRWFLTEYAKRNRNADTRMVLDAVARIEQSLAAQKEDTVDREESLHREESLRQEASLAAQERAAAATAAAAEDSLAKALAAIRGAVEAAQESAVEALDSLALEQRLAPVRKGARVLREIAWRLREIGNDVRICDLIDSQVTVIEKGAEQISSEQATAALSAAFGTLAGQLEAFGDAHRAPAPLAETAAVSPSPTPPDEPAAGDWTIETASALEMLHASSSPAQAFSSEAEPGSRQENASNQEAEARFRSYRNGNGSGPAEAAPAEVELDVADAEASVATELAGEAADAQDDALLDMIAMEMGAPDPVSDDEIAAAVAEAQVDDPVEPEIAAVAPRPVEAASAPPVQKPVQPAQAVAKAETAPPAEASLGSTIIARGMLRKPAASANDPLAPIRRMSQAEKIAFFS